MSTFNFARMLGLKTERNTPEAKKDRGLDLATANPGFAKILKAEPFKPQSINRSAKAWEVRARGLFI